MLCLVQHLPVIPPAIRVVWEVASSTCHARPATIFDILEHSSPDSKLQKPSRLREPCGNCQWNPRSRSEGSDSRFPSMYASPSGCMAAERMRTHDSGHS